MELGSARVKWVVELSGGWELSDVVGPVDWGTSALAVGGVMMSCPDGIMGLLDNYIIG